MSWVSSSVTDESAGQLGDPATPGPGGRVRCCYGGIPETSESSSSSRLPEPEFCLDLTLISAMTATNEMLKQLEVRDIPSHVYHHLLSRENVH